MRHARVLVVWLAAPAGLLMAASPSVELNVVPSARAPLTAGQDWVRALSTLKSVRVTSSRAVQAKPDVERRPTIIRITAVINGSNQLLVPGRQFGLRQVAAIQAWIDEQRQDRAELPTKDRFGLTTRQLTEVHETLKRVVRFSTTDLTADEVLQRIARRTGYPVRLTGQDRSTLRARSCTDQLEGMSSGTAIAILLRPMQLVFVPKVNSAGKVELHLAPAQHVEESWPIGWDSQLKREQLVPKIFDKLEIEISTPITTVLAAVQDRLETPFFLDHAALASAKVVPEDVKVTLPLGRMSYSTLLRRALFQAKMKSELQVDERGKAFFWITQ